MNDTARCRDCGFPIDTPGRAHTFIHEQFEALIAHRKGIKELRDENSALLENLEILHDAMKVGGVTVGGEGYIGSPRFYIVRALLATAPR